MIRFGAPIALGLYGVPALAISGDFSSDILTTFTNLVGIVGVIILGLLGLALLRSGFGIVWRILLGVGFAAFVRSDKDKEQD